MSDDLPLNVLTELGRVTWAAIKLEDYVGDICRRIEQTAGQAPDRRPISQKIKDAKKILTDGAPSVTSEKAIVWLERARQAVERRNAALNATPIVWIGRERNDQLGLGEMPRRGSPYVERPLTVESPAELRSALQEAADGWADLTVALSTESMERVSAAATSNLPGQRSS